MLTVSFSIAIVALLITASSSTPVLAQPGPFAQSEKVQANSVSDSFFSGSVVEFAADHVLVSRTILGKPAETRTFKINADTKTEGKLKQKSRVTVRYAPSEEGDVALSILVRDRPEKDGVKDPKKK